MAGKMLFDDPVLTCEFTARTRVDLRKGHKKLLVVCSTPESIKSEFPSLDFDLLELVARNLRQNEIETVSLDEVATWLDDVGGSWESPSELAEQFDADYIIHIDLDEFDFREKSSPNLLRGRALGNVYAYRVSGEGGQKFAAEVFVSEFRSEYPRHSPVPSDQVSPKTFRSDYVRQVSKKISRLFYNYRMGSDY
jgi:hypothetical protein